MRLHHWYFNPLVSFDSIQSGIYGNQNDANNPIIFYDFTTFPEKGAFKGSKRFSS